MGGLPALNSFVETSRGMGKVTKLNVLARQVEVTIPDLPAPVWFTLDQLNAVEGAKPAATPEIGCPKCPRKEDDNAMDIAVFEETYLEEDPHRRASRSHARVTACRGTPPPAPPP